jgi:hypothetical protein
MRPLVSIWDFFFGALCIAAAPIITLVALAFPATLVISKFGSQVGSLSLLVNFITFLVVFCGPIASIWFVTRWRARRTVMPVWVITLEVVVGLAVCASFCLYALLMWSFAYVE